MPRGPLFFAEGLVFFKNQYFDSDVWGFEPVCPWAVIFAEGLDFYNNMQGSVRRPLIQYMEERPWSQKKALIFFSHPCSCESTSAKAFIIYSFICSLRFCWCLLRCIQSWCLDPGSNHYRSRIETTGRASPTDSPGMHSLVNNELVLLNMAQMEAMGRIKRGRVSHSSSTFRCIPLP